MHLSGLRLSGLYCSNELRLYQIAEHSGVDLMRLKPNPLDLFSFSALTLLVGSFDLWKPVPDMTYNVFWWDVKPCSIYLSIYRF